jgi:hypothetical protein
LYCCMALYWACMMLGLIVTLGGRVIWPPDIRWPPGTLPGCGE